MNATVIALADVVRERERQDDKWGQQDHDNILWSAILVEEVGEFAQEALTERFGASGNGHGDAREELVQIAAVAVAAIEAIDRRHDGE
jgi:NTP pyrophosphatase (non-canonical NTP hydrolase)